jgi:hypothetical protein
MSPDEQARYVADCRRHNSSLGPYAIGSHRQVLDSIAALCTANDELPVDRIRPGAAIDGLPNLGKTTLLRAVGRRYERTMRAQWGWETDAGDEYWPVCHICIPGGSTIAGLNAKVIEFFRLVERQKESIDSSTKRIIDALRLAGTSLVLIDDLHFIKPTQLKGQRLNDHLKHLMNEVPATFVFAGVALLEAGIFREGNGKRTQQYAQLARRLGRFPVKPLAPDSDEWRGILRTFERDIRLIGPIRLADRVMSRYLYERTGGSLGELAGLLRLAALESLSRDAAAPSEAKGMTLAVLEGIELSQGAQELRPPARKAPAARRPRSAAAV